MSRYLNLADRFGSTLHSEADLGRLPADDLKISREDVKILRSLGKKKHEYAMFPVMDERRAMWTAANDLRMTKPPVYVDEICWPEMNREGELTCIVPIPLPGNWKSF